MYYRLISSAVPSPFFTRFGNLYNSSGLGEGGLTGTVIYFDRVSSSGKLKSDQIKKYK